MVGMPLAGILLVGILQRSQGNSPLFDKISTNTLHTLAYGF
jgi:hypothetical protein